MTAAPAPLVSILTPSFQQGRYLPDCIASVAAQTYRPVEHIVCDGGSTDETLEVLRAAPAHVRWVSEPDGGQAAALNKAFALSRGAIIGWLNSDDAYADRRAIEWAVAAFSQDPRLRFVYGHSLLVNEQNSVLHVQHAPRFDRKLLESVHFVVQPTVFFPRAAVESEPLFLDERLHYVLDRELWLRLSRSGRAARVSRVVAIDRHQRDRKVLDLGLADEARALDTSLGIDPSQRAGLRARSSKFVLRMLGTAEAIRLPRSLEPAFELRVPGLASRLRLQWLTPRSKMGF